MVGCVIEMISIHFHLNVTQMQQCNTYLCLRLCSFSQCTAFIGFILIMLCCYFVLILCFVIKTIYLKKNAVYTFIHIDGLSYLREWIIMKIWSEFYYKYDHKLSFRATSGRLQHIMLLLFIRLRVILSTEFNSESIFLESISKFNNTDRSFGEIQLIFNFVFSF